MQSEILSPSRLEVEQTPAAVPGQATLGVGEQAEAFDMVHQAEQAVPVSEDLVQVEALDTGARRRPHPSPRSPQQCQVQPTEHLVVDGVHLERLVPSGVGHQDALVVQGELVDVGQVLDGERSSPRRPRD